MKSSLLGPFYAQVLEEYNVDGLKHILGCAYTFGHDIFSASQSTTSLIAKAYLYTAYGEMLTGASQKFTDAANALTNLLYSGEWTQKNGQQYLRARFYDPSTGAFNRLDPFSGNQSDPQSLHKYLYTHANPVMGIDPSGSQFTLASVSAAIGVSVTISGILGGTTYAITGDVRASINVGLYSSLGTLAVGLAFLSAGGPPRALGVLTAGLIGGLVTFLVDFASDKVRIDAGKHPIGGPPSAAKYFQSAARGFGASSWDAFLKPGGIFASAAASSGGTFVYSILDDVISGNDIDWNEAIRDSVISAALGLLVSPKVLNSTSGFTGEAVDEVLEDVSGYLSALVAFEIGVLVQTWLP